MISIYNNSTTNPITQQQLNSFIKDLQKQLKPLKLKISKTQNSNNLIHQLTPLTSKKQYPFIFLTISDLYNNPISISKFLLSNTNHSIKFNNKQIYSLIF